MRLIIIDHEPFKNFKCPRYFFDYFVSDGFSVEYWSVCHAFSYTQIKSAKFDQPVTPITIIDFKSSSVLLHAIEELKIDDCIIFLDVFFLWETLPLFRLLKKKAFNVFAIEYFRNHPGNAFPSKENKFINALEKLSLRDLFKKAREYISFKTLLMIEQYCNPVSIIFITGQDYVKRSKNVIYKSISSFDVDNYERCLVAHRIIKEPYIVFLDDFLPYHPDVQRAGKSTISPNIYYDKLNRTFEQIEKQTNLKVVIAAHPKSVYSEQFGERIKIKSKTAELVKDSELVVAHASASINFAVLAGKKVVLIYSNDFLNTESILKTVKNAIYSYQRLLNTEIINMDEEFTINKVQIDTQAYELYIKRYLYALEYPLSNYAIIKKEIAALKS